MSGKIVYTAKSRSQRLRERRYWVEAQNGAGQWYVAYYIRFRWLARYCAWNESRQENEPYRVVDQRRSDGAR